MEETAEQPMVVESVSTPVNQQTSGNTGELGWKLVTRKTREGHRSAVVPTPASNTFQLLQDETHDRGIEEEVGGVNPYLS